MSRFIVIPRPVDRYDGPTPIDVIDTAPGRPLEPHVIATTDSLPAAQRLTALLNGHQAAWDAPRPASPRPHRPALLGGRP